MWITCGRLVKISGSYAQNTYFTAQFSIEIVSCYFHHAICTRKRLCSEFLKTGRFILRGLEAPDGRRCAGVSLTTRRAFPRTGCFPWWEQAGSVERRAVQPVFAGDGSRFRRRGSWLLAVLTPDLGNPWFPGSTRPGFCSGRGCRKGSSA